MPIHDVEQITRSFYETLRREVVKGNPYLDQNEQKALQSHYPVMVNPAQYPTELAATIYVSRRQHSVQAILDVPRSIVFDAGCGYGSESFLFAKLGATVLSVDRSFEQIAIARKRLRYYEELFEQKLDIHFVTADLNEYIPEMAELSLTWLASVLAAIRDQEAFLARVYQATRPEGRVILTDMNLWNPLFLVKEWGRRRRNQMDSPEFARSADFLAMVRRKGRKGARFFPSAHGAMIDDVQFFTPVTLSQLLRTVGFCQVTSTYSGFLPPPLFSPIGLMLERSLDKVPILRGMGYFYLVSGQK